MDKQDYINITNTLFTPQARQVMLKQIDNFYALDGAKLKMPVYKVGDYVKLKKDTYMHGFGNDLKLLEIFSKFGLINKDFEQGAGTRKITHCVSLWHIKKPILLKDYIVNYSGMTVSYDDKYDIVPYKQFDQYIEKIRKHQYWSLRVESTMETRFMPSLAKDSNRLQLAFIINGYDKQCKDIMYHDLLNDKVDLDIVLNFMHLKNPDHAEMFKQNRQNYDDKRIGYVMFGIPRCMFEGVLIGRKYEHNKRILSRIKTLLPDCYICNLDGKVIVE